MSGFLKSLVPVAAVITVLLLLSSASNIAPTQAARDVAHNAASDVPPSPKALDQMQEIGAFYQELAPSLMSLGRARSAMLRVAAQSLDDPKSLKAASAAYRDAIVQLRNKIEDLPRKLDAGEANRLMGLMMGQATSESQHIMAGELFGAMDL